MNPTLSLLPPEPLDQPALPRRAMWFFVVAPPFLAFLFDPACAKEPGHLARALVALTLYTAVTGLAVHHGYEWMVRRTRGLAVAARVPLLLGFDALVVLAVTLPQLPLIGLVYPEAVGDEATIVVRALIVSYAYLGLATFIGHLQGQAERERSRARRERTAALEARLLALQAQLQPHFLFNSLNVCAGLAHEDPDRAEATLDRLAGFLRYALDSSERAVVPLADELDAMRAYLEVQRQRFGERLGFEVEHDGARGSVPPLLLQPLVENAVLHGVRERGGTVRVRAEAAGGDLVLTVEDDGVGASRHAGTGLGQRSVRERLGLLYGDRATAHMGPAPEGGGYRCRIVIPRTR